MRSPNRVERARGCLLGQLVGDALGSQVEFSSPEEIRRAYPDGVRDMADGGTRDTLAGQPTDDSEMALALARMLVSRGGYDAGAARQAYLDWLRSEPFDRDGTITAGLGGEPKPDSQANGALMRISPLGIFGSGYALSQVGHWARQDAELTHPHPICLQVNALFAMAVAKAIATGAAAKELVSDMLAWAQDMDADPILFRVIKACINEPPRDYHRHKGWVLIAFGNAVWQLLNAPSLEEGIVDTIQRGGDTDTNAAICGALLGAVHGLGAVPERWLQTVLACRPKEGLPGVRRPRPEIYWPVDALKLAEQLLQPTPRVFFVGAGPGDPDLLTIKAQRLIREADLIIYAGSLVPVAMLDGAGPGCRIVDSSGLTLNQTHELIRNAVSSGQMVVRLHTGDPGLYGAVREQARLLDAEGISHAVVPGVTAAMAAAAAAKVSFTIPKIRQTLIMTRLDGRTRVPELEQLRGLAAHQAALAVYLSGPNHQRLARELLDGGYPPDTTIIAAHRVGWPEENIQRLTLDKLARTEAKPLWERQTIFLVLPGQELASTSRLYAPEFEHGFRGKEEFFR